MQTYDIQETTTAEKLTSIAARLDALTDQIDALEAQVADLDEAGVCTGVPYWRDGTGGSRARPKLYANHGVDQACPIHGRPEPGKRLRTYVGADPEAQEEALAAIARYEQKADLETCIRHVEMQRGRVERAIAEAWRAATGKQRWER
jgi:hypothetical protein